jgi:hypothetical protein
MRAMRRMFLEAVLEEDWQGLVLRAGQEGREAAARPN